MCSALFPALGFLREQVRRLDPVLLHTLLQTTVTALQGEIPGLGEIVAFDVKHIYAWVKQNNLRDYVPQRYNPERQPAGDPHCPRDVQRAAPSAEVAGPSRSMLPPGSDKGLERALREPLLTPRPSSCTSPSLILV